MCLSIVETKNGRLLNAPDSTWGRSCFEVLLSCHRALGCQYTSKCSKDKHIDYQVGYVLVWAILVQAWSMVCCKIHDRLALSFANVFPLADNEQIVLAQQTLIDWNLFLLGCIPGVGTRTVTFECSHVQFEGLNPVYTLDSLDIL